MKWLYREQEKGRNGLQEIIQVSCLGGLKKIKAGWPVMSGNRKIFRGIELDVLGVKWVAYVYVPAD
jgi:hypothetical protein